MAQSGPAIEVGAVLFMRYRQYSQVMLLRIGGIPGRPRAAVLPSPESLPLLAPPATPQESPLRLL